jgi:radical SAM superfamily enzyme YgiQ (UPF0313 family)
MKILFVNPYIYDFTAYDLWLRPVGLLYIAAVVRKFTGCEIFWLDALDRFQEGAGVKSGKSGRGKYYREIVKKPEIYEQTPRYYARYGIPVETFREKIEKLPEMDMIVLTTLMTYWIEGVQFTLNILVNRFPDAKIVVGGVIPSLIPREKIEEYISADFYVSGYGEKKILEIIEREGGKIYPYPDFFHIDNIPFPAFELLTNRRTLPLLTSRGCPYHCAYCASGILNKKFVERSVEKILEEIYDMHETFGTEEVVIFDDAFLVNRRKRFFRVFAEVSQKLKLRFHTPNGLHPGEIDEETAEILFKSGFETLRLSFESIKDDILSRSSNKVTVEKMMRAVENLEKAGYKRGDIGVYLLFGYPGQGLADIEQSLRFAKELGVSPHLALFSPVPGTVDFNNLQHSGVLATPTDLYETNKIYYLYNKPGLSREEIKYIKDLSIEIIADVTRKPEKP